MKNVKLEGDYMNHSIRSTVISMLDKDGFEAHHIMALSSHKSESTIKEYAVKCPDSKRKAMFNSLSNALVPEPEKAKTAPAEASGKPPDKELLVTYNKICHHLTWTQLTILTL